MEDLIVTCTWDSRAHKADCSLNPRNRYAKRELFPKVTPDQGKTFQLGEYCAIHRARMVNKHLICRVTQICKNHYRLYCKSGILSENFSSSDLTTCPKKDDIPLDKWRQSCVISVRGIPDKDLDECLCVLQPNTTDYISVSDDEPDLEQLDVDTQRHFLHCSYPLIYMALSPKSSQGDLYILALSWCLMFPCRLLPQ